MRGSVAFGLNPSSRLWKPVQVGAATINHRVSLPACTRMRSPQHLPAPFVATFYEQRSSGGLMVSEATLIAKEAGGYPNTPGIWSHEQVSIWRDIVKGVHAKGSVFYCQLWALGRANGGYEPDVKCVGPSDIPLSTSKKGKPEQMTLEDIDRYLNHYRTAAQNAMEAGNALMTKASMAVRSMAPMGTWSINFCRLLVILCGRINMEALWRIVLVSYWTPFKL